MIMSSRSDFRKVSSAFDSLCDEVHRLVQRGASLGTLEALLWKQLHSIGLAFEQAFVSSRGLGDVGDEVEVDGEAFRRLPRPHARRLMTVFGPLTIERYVYGTRETQKHEVIPLDAALDLPADEQSYLLQDWCQSFCVEQSFANSRSALSRILGFDPSVRTLERMNQTMARDVPAFQSSKPAPPAREEGALVVLTADCKGVPMCRRDSPAPSGRRTKGQKANKKRMACVGAAYTIEPFIRDARDVVDERSRAECRPDRPKPQHKEVRAALTQRFDGDEYNGKDAIFDWLSAQAAIRNRSRKKKPVIAVMDGERGLWTRLSHAIPDCVCILDLYHLLERLWTVAHCFHAEGSPAATAFVDDRLLRILEGKIGRVIGGIRQMMAKRRMGASRRKTLTEAITYLQNNRKYMNYDEYLAEGYPIGSGVAEGACRHLVKDRMERTGMRWRVEGAQAMLNLRAVAINGEWDAFQTHRVEDEQRRLYPYKDLLKAQCREAA